MAVARISSLLPGLLLAALLALTADALARLQQLLPVGVRIDGLVLAILLGATMRALFAFDARCLPGIDFAARRLLELAIVLLGASLSLAEASRGGPVLVGSVMLIVIASIAGGYGIGRALGLPVKLALLIACGNSICGNSAIVAVAPVIDARAEDTAAALAFTAVLGILVVVLLPLLPHVALLTFPQYGIMAGMTVYAVPQVLAAAAPGGLLAIQAGTVVKLLRVLMLGPVILGLTAWSGRHAASRRPGGKPLLPWFIVGFGMLATMRSLGWLPEWSIAPALSVSHGLTLVSMAALGLSVDLRDIGRAGTRVILAALLSLLLLAGISYVATTTVLAQAFA